LSADITDGANDVGKEACDEPSQLVDKVP